MKKKKTIKLELDVSRDGHADFIVDDLLDYLNRKFDSNLVKVEVK